VPDKHVTDEEIYQASGHAPRMPAGIPKATCLNCGQEHESFYAIQACDCRISLAERKTYAEWLLYFQRLGMGVLQTPEARKFRFEKVITGRQALTFHLQSDLDSPRAGQEFAEHYCCSFMDAGFPVGAEDILSAN